MHGGFMGDCSVCACLEVDAATWGGCSWRVCLRCVCRVVQVCVQTCACRYFYKDVGVGHMPTSVCVPASLCEVSLDTGTVAGSSVWILPQERWGPALASALMCGCSWAPFLCPLAHEGSSPPSLPLCCLGTWGTGTGQ